MNAIDMLRKELVRAAAQIRSLILSDREEEYLEAAVAIQSVMPLLEDEECEPLRKALVPILPVVTKVVRKGIWDDKVFDERVAFSISCLGVLGDADTFRLLEEILAHLKRTISREGVTERYVDYGKASGFVSSEDHLRHVERALVSISHREAGIPTLLIGERGIVKADGTPYYVDS